MADHIYREYDIRGIFPQDLSEDEVKKIGYHIGLKIVDKGMSNIAVGYDSRSHSITLFNWLVSGLNKAGLKVLSVGEVATPIAYYATYQEYEGNIIKNCIMITGSHNPPEYNGFKIVIDNKPFYGEDIYKLRDEIEESIIEVEENTQVIETNHRQEYIDFLVTEFSNLKGSSKSICIDNGNGVGGPIAREVLDRLEIKANILYENSDGNFPNHLADPSIDSNMEDLKKEMVENEYDLGCAFDGDTDRIYFEDGGQTIKPDSFAIIIAKTMDNPIVIGEVKCTKVMYDEINKIGKAVMYKTGHSNIKKKISELNATFAVELSGHIFFNDRYYGYDDGIYVMLRGLELVNSGVNFKEEFDKFPKMFITTEIKTKVPEDKKFELIERYTKKAISKEYDLPQIKEYSTIDGIRIEFEHGWGLVRASNTSPYFTSRFEADTQENAEMYKEKMLNALNEELER